MLYTNTFTKHEDWRGLGVRTTLGHPRFGVGYPMEIGFRLLTPEREYLKAPLEVYRPKYLAKLERVGVPTLTIAMREVAERHQRDNLVFLCFENLSKPGTWCHRRLFAQWWQEQTGEIVEELGPLAPPPFAPPDMSLFE